MKKIPVGVENFKELIDENYNYIDKTMFIKDVMDEKFALYARPRRFGKTLNMSMLYYFFSINEKDNAYLFDGLEISKDEEAMKLQNQYPVIFISLKDMKRTSFEMQVKKYAALIQDILKVQPSLFDSEYLDDLDKSMLHKYKYGLASRDELLLALKNIIFYLYKHYQKKVIVLIDEYDVPLSAAYSNDYYDDMTSFLSEVLSSALKTNDNVEKGIFTGCLRIAKESIFTGLNHFKVYSIDKLRSSSRFGFTNEEIESIAKHYQIEDKITIIKDWYDGYLFGNHEIYNPWSVLMYVDQAMDGEYDPVAFWANTSGNDIVRKYIEKSDDRVHGEFEQLIQGEPIEKKIKPELTYNEMDDINNIYSFLLFTGYLRIHKVINRSYNIYELEIPNKEVKEIYSSIFEEWFKDVVDKTSNPFIDALLEDNIDQATLLLTKILRQSVSYYDTKEVFYHGLLIGLLHQNELIDKIVSSNLESGDGRFDIAVLPILRNSRGFVLEVKIVEDEDLIFDILDKACAQIKEKKYIEGLQAKRYTNIIGYGVVFYKKSCFIQKA